MRDALCRRFVAGGSHADPPPIDDCLRMLPVGSGWQGPIIGSAGFRFRDRRGARRGSMILQSVMQQRVACSLLGWHGRCNTPSMIDVLESQLHRAPPSRTGRRRPAGIRPSKNPQLVPNPRVLTGNKQKASHMKNHVLALATFVSAVAALPMLPLYPAVAGFLIAAPGVIAIFLVEYGRPIRQSGA